MELKDTLKQIREEHGLTKRELCQKTGISERAYLTYEFGEREPKISVIQKLADFYGVTTDYLLGRDSQKNNDLTPTQREEIATQKWLSLDKEKRDALLQMMETCIKTFEAAESNHKKSQEQEQPVKQSTTLGTLEDQMEEAAT